NPCGEHSRAHRMEIGKGVGRWGRRRPTAAALVAGLVAVAVGLPAAGWQLFSQFAARRQEARADVLDLLGRGQAAAAGGDWKQAELLLDRAAEKVEAAPALAALAERVEAARAPVKERLATLAAYQDFVRDRDEALFHATLGGGEHSWANRQ